MDDYVLPRVPASAGALLRDDDGRILILKPTYKSGWTVPGGQIEEDGESPWEGCRREVAEETGLDVTSGRLACVGLPPPQAGAARRHPVPVRLRCRRRRPARAGWCCRIEEISEARWAPPDEAVHLLSGPVGRRVAQALAASGTVYLESGRPVPGVDGW